MRTRLLPPMALRNQAYIGHKHPIGSCPLPFPLSDKTGPAAFPPADDTAIGRAGRNRRGWHPGRSVHGRAGNARIRTCIGSHGQSIPIPDHRIFLRIRAISVKRQFPRQDHPGSAHLLQLPDGSAVHCSKLNRNMESAAGAYRRASSMTPKSAIIRASAPVSLHHL